MYRIVLLTNLLFVFSCYEERKIPYYNNPDFSPLFVSNKNDVDNIITHKIGDFSFVDQNKKVISQNDIEKKIHIANFIFTSCTSICPSMTNNMKIVDSAFHNNSRVKILSYSVTPWIDTPDRFKSYTKEYNISSENWHFLTGSKNDIYKLARESYFAEESLGFSRDSTDFLHTEFFILVDGNKRIRGVYNGTLKLEALQAVEDIKELLNN